MKVAMYLYTRETKVSAQGNDQVDRQAVQLVLVFGARRRLGGSLYGELRAEFPRAEIVLCSTAGEIFGTVVSNDSVTATAIEFQDTVVRTAAVEIGDFDGDSFAAGKAVVEGLLDHADLCHLLLFSDGGAVNGSDLVRGVNSLSGNRVPVTGGLAGDGTDFTTTVTGLNGEPRSGAIVAIGFYGRSLLVSYGSMGGWERFGPEMTVTRSEANRVYQIDQSSALALYKKYLGPYAAELPGSAMFFPLSVLLPGDDQPVGRTILSIDPTSESMVFAGNVPEGSRVRLMKGHFDKLIEAANEAAGQTIKDLALPKPRLALLVSCVGRKIVLDNRVDEEVEAVQEVYSSGTLITGFYSYGELSPFSGPTRCELHNQTMTITTFVEG